MDRIGPAVGGALGDRTITVEVDPDGWSAGGQFTPIAADALRLTGIYSNVAVDNDRDEMIEFDVQDYTTESKPFLFWLNGNRDVWGGNDYQAAVSAHPISGLGATRFRQQLRGFGIRY